MILLVNKLIILELSVIVQNFKEHDGQLIKVYNICDTSNIYIRPSINLVVNTDENNIVSFRTSDLLSEKFIKEWKDFSEKLNFNSKINENYLKAITHVYKELEEMSLFGLDLIFSSKKNTYYLVDTNYYPGYKEMTCEFNTLLIDGLIDKYN